MPLNLSRTIAALRTHELPTADADALAAWIERAHDALRWYASADYGPKCRADAQVRMRAVEALKGVE